MQTYIAHIRFYEELNDFLTLSQRKMTFDYHFRNNPSVKDVIESLGVPHTEVDLILVNGKSKKFSYQLKNNDRIAVFPVFENFDISKINKLRTRPLRRIKFILDVHLGKLAHYLRLLGFDTLYRNDYSDQQIVLIAKNQKRIILTRDVGLLKNKIVLRGYWLRNTQPKEQVTEIIHRFNLLGYINPFSRCMECNGKIIKVSQKLAQQNLPLRVQKYYKKFFRCMNCKRIYWQGSHYQKLTKFIGSFIKT